MEGRNMGNTFGSIHIRTNEIEEVKQAIQRSQTEKEKLPSFLLENKAALDIMNLIHESKNDFTLSNIMDGWVSVLHYDFKGEYVHDYALQLSHQLTYPIVSVFYFDDEIFQLYLSKSGKLVTSYVSGDLDSDEGVTPDLQKMLDVLKLDAPSQDLEEIFQSKDLEELVSRLEDIFQVPIWGMSPDAVEDFDEKVQHKFHRIKI
jgi:hypothetical protein